MSLFDSDDLSSIHRARLFPLPFLSATCKSSVGSARSRYRAKVATMITSITNRCILTLNLLYHPAYATNMSHTTTLPPFVLNESDNNSSFNSFPSFSSPFCSSSQFRLLSRIRTQCATFVLTARAWCHSEPACDIRPDDTDAMLTSIGITDPVGQRFEAMHLPESLSVTHSYSFIEGEIPLAEWSSVPLPLKPTFSSASSSLTLIRADRIALPDNLHIIPLVNVLPPEMAHLYSLPSSPSLLRDPIEIALLNVNSPVARPRILGPRHEYVKLIDRLRREGMIDFTDSPRAVNGVFAVRKDRDTDRLIIDAQPANRLFVDSPYVNLPNPSHLVQLLVPEGSTLFIGKLDLSNFYHHLGLPRWMTLYFALPPLTESELSSIGIVDPQGARWPVCLTLPMGFSHAVYLAESIHEHVLYSSGALRPEDNILCLTVPEVPPVRPLHGIIIDDFFQLAVIEWRLSDSSIGSFKLIGRLGSLLRPLRSYGHHLI